MSERPDWTEAEVLTVREMRSSKWSAGGIAIYFGLPRDVVTGRLHDLGLIRQPAPPAADTDPGMLTPNQRETMQLICQGKTLWEIGRILGTTERAIADRVKKVRGKLGATNITHAAILFDRQERGQ